MSTPITLMTYAWTKPYHGVTHYGDMGKKRRATVVDYGTFAELQKWYEGCGLQPIEETYPTADAAKAAGAEWVDNPGVAKP